MKIGDYVRTKEFGINRVKWFDHEEPILENGFTALQHSGYKSSPNIIDLIEVGDYVNDREVTSVQHHITSSDTFLGFGNYDYYISKNKDIKSIVTKEQFESMEYKVGE